MSKEDQARWHVLSDSSSVGANGFSQQLNKLHCGVGWFAGWLFGNVVSPLLVVGGWCFTWNMEAYSVAGKTYLH